MSLDCEPQGQVLCLMLCVAPVALLELNKRSTTVVSWLSGYSRISRASLWVCSEPDSAQALCLWWAPNHIVYAPPKGNPVKIQTSVSPKDSSLPVSVMGHGRGWDLLLRS